jgi:glycosyltransferase involved in cell wall biosynthesis
MKIKVIPNIFFDITDLKQDSIQTVNQIIWIGNIKPVKQPNIFFRLAMDKRLEKFKFLMLGALQDRSYLKEIEQLQERNKRFNYLGYVPYEESQKYISNSKILVNVSHHEGYSNTFIQAFASGVPVISLNSNPDDIFNQYKIGFCTKTYNNMVDKILLLSNNIDLYHQMKQECLKYFNMKFSIDSLTDQYLSIFQHVLNQNH